MNLSENNESIWSLETKFEPSIYKKKKKKKCKRVKTILEWKFRDALPIYDDFCVARWDDDIVNKSNHACPMLSRRFLWWSFMKLNECTKVHFLVTFCSIFTRSFNFLLKKY